MASTLVIESPFSTVGQIIELLKEWTSEDRFQVLDFELDLETFLVAINALDQDFNLVERLEYHIENKDVTAVFLKSDAITYSDLELDDETYDELIDLIEQGETGVPES